MTFSYMLCVVVRAVSRAILTHASSCKVGISRPIDFWETVSMCPDTGKGLDDAGFLDRSRSNTSHDLGSYGPSSNGSSMLCHNLGTREAHTFFRTYTLIGKGKIHYKAIMRGRPLTLITTLVT